MGLKKIINVEKEIKMRRLVIFGPVGNISAEMSSWSRLKHPFPVLFTTQHRLLYEEGGKKKFPKFYP